MSMFGYRRVLILVVAIFVLMEADSAYSKEVTDFAVFGASDVTLSTYSLSNGDVYAAEDLDIDFGYGIQRPTTSNQGSMYAGRDYRQGSLSEVNGNVFAGRNAELEGSGKIFGNVTYGDELTRGTSSQINGTSARQAGVVPSVEMPTPTSFSAGSENVIANDHLTLEPGAYRDLEMNQSFRTLSLSSGDYFFRSIDFATSIEINMLLFEGPLRVFVEQDARLGSGLQFRVNGLEVGEDNNGLMESLASNVLLESHSDVEIESGFLNEFFGTIYTPFGGVDMDLQDIHGSIVAQDAIVGNAYVDFQPSNLLNVASSVPEPSSLIMLVAGTITGGSRRRKA